ncbi:MAG: TatD family hydrolase [Planctomycetes bacterium]|nr:TatD family hydrolase [Planctomycetota bacterium]
MPVDSHAHLDFPEYEPDRAAVVERARAAGLTRIVTIGTTLEKSRAAIAIAAQFPEMVVPAVGIHPHDSAHLSDADWAEFERMAADPRVVAIGETGLDYFKNYAPREVQQSAFERQMRIARDLGKPIIIHCRDAFADCWRLLGDPTRRPAAGVIHCFSGTADDAGQAAGIGYHVSYSGTVTFPKSQALRETVRLVPHDRLLVETDCPFLAPQPVRGKRNEPAFVAHTLGVVAQAAGMTPEEAERVTTENAARLFRWGG